MAYNVLLVDDSSIVRKVMIKTFGMTNIPVNTFYQAENGLRGLEILEGNWIDIVFLDINMPVMNGLEFIRKLRDNPQLKDIPVIVVSTEGSKERKEELQHAGVKAYLRKPVTPETLVSTIEQVFGAMTDERST